MIGKIAGVISSDVPRKWLADNKGILLAAERELSSQLYSSVPLD